MLGKNEEVTLVALAEIKGQCGGPVPRLILGLILNKVVGKLDKRKIPFFEKSACQHAQNIVRRVMRSKPGLKK